MTRPVPRPYQADAMHRLRVSLSTARRSILCSPTGSGKSVMIADMIYGAQQKGSSAWLICHRKELLDQLSGTLWEAGVPHGVIASGRTMTHELVQVASVQTLVRRLDRLRPPNLLAIDEAHHATAKTYRKIMEHCRRSYVVGLTATPVRTDGEGLDDLFDDIVEGPSVSWLMEHGYLARYRLIAPPSQVDLSGVKIRGGDYARGELADAMDQGALVGDAVRHYQRYLGNSPGKTCLVYCVNRNHARHVEAMYLRAGIRAAYCAGDTERGRRKRIIEGFRHGDPAVIVSVDLFGEGLDVPRLDAVQLLRPTQSLGLHLQQIGRALRPDGDKVALILDHAGNTWKHGLPDDEREWSLEGTRSKDKDANETGPELRQCEECFAIFAPNVKNCPECGAEVKFGEKSPLPDEVDGELEEIDPEEHRRNRRREERAADTLEALVRLAIERKYRPGWAAHRHAARTRGNLGQLKRKEFEIRKRIASGVI